MNTPFVGQMVQYYDEKISKPQAGIVTSVSQDAHGKDTVNLHLLIDPEISEGSNYAIGVSFVNTPDSNQLYRGALCIPAIARD